MKPKKFSKRLSLNKKTIADLNNGQLDNVKGGLTQNPCPGTVDCPFSYTCPSGGLRGQCCEPYSEDTCLRFSCDTCLETNCNSGACC